MTSASHLDHDGWLGFHMPIFKLFYLTLLSKDSGTRLFLWFVLQVSQVRFFFFFFLIPSGSLFDSSIRLHDLSDHLWIPCLVPADVEGRAGEDRKGDSVLGARDGGEHEGHDDDEIGEDNSGDARPPQGPVEQ